MTVEIDLFGRFLATSFSNRVLILQALIYTKSTSRVTEVNMTHPTVKGRMSGFLVEGNESLKSGWRLFINPETVSATVFFGSRQATFRRFYHVVDHTRSFRLTVTLFDELRSWSEYVGSSCFLSLGRQTKLCPFALTISSDHIDVSQTTTEMLPAKYLSAMKTETSHRCFERELIYLLLSE